MATTICLEVSVGVDVSPAAFERWVFSQLNMPGALFLPDVNSDVLEDDLDAIDNFEGKIEVQRLVPVTSELCSAEASHV